MLHPQPIEPIFPVWTPSDTLRPTTRPPSVGQGCVEFQLARRFYRRESGFTGRPDARRPLHRLVWVRFSAHRPCIPHRSGQEPSRSSAQHRLLPKHGSETLSPRLPRCYPVDPESRQLRDRREPCPDDTLASAAVRRCRAGPKKGTRARGCRSGRRGRNAKPNRTGGQADSVWTEGHWSRRSGPVTVGRPITNKWFYAKREQWQELHQTLDTGGRRITINAQSKFV